MHWLELFVSPTISPRRSLKVTADEMLDDLQKNLVSMVIRWTDLDNSTTLPDQRIFDFLSETCNRAFKIQFSIKMHLGEFVEKMKCTPLGQDFLSWIMINGLCSASSPININFLTHSQSHVCALTIATWHLILEIFTSRPPNKQQKLMKNEKQFFIETRKLKNRVTRLVQSMWLNYSLTSLSNEEKTNNYW